MNSGPIGIERRREIRRPILESFHMHVEVPSYGAYRMRFYDVCTMGISFDYGLDDDEDNAAVLPGSEFDIKLYLNETLSLPLTIRVAHVSRVDGKWRVGAEFIKRESKAYNAYLQFVNFVDGLNDCLLATADKKEKEFAIF